MNSDRGVKVRLKGIHRVRARGRTYFYAWRGGPALSGDPALSEEAAREFFALRDVRRKLPSSTVVAAIAAEYRASPDFGGRSAKWKREKNRFLDAIIAEFGEDDISLFEDKATRRDIHEFRDTMSATPRKADHVIGELSAFLNWCRDRGLVSTNLAEGVGKIGVVDRSETIIGEAEHARLCAAASDGAGLAFRLARVTGLARADLIKALWSEVMDNAIQTSRAKTGEPVTIPLYADLRALLAEIPKRGPTILTTRAGRKWSGDGLTKAFERARDKAKLNPDLRLHDYRGTAATYFYGMGLKDDDVAAILGWSLKSCRSIKRRYVSRTALASAQILLLDANAKRTKNVKPRGEV